MTYFAFIAVTFFVPRDLVTKVDRKPYVFKDSYLYVSEQHIKIIHKVIIYILIHMGEHMVNIVYFPL